MPKKLTAKYLEKKKVPKVLIAGLVMASVLGWTGWNNLDKVKNYYQIKTIFPIKTQTTNIIDGDTFIIKNGMTVRLLGIDAPNRGKDGAEQAKEYLENLIKNKSLSFEYDTYQDDKFGRILAYVWISCLPQIQQYCHENRALVNEVMIKTNHAQRLIYEDRKKLKYDSYLNP